MKEAAEFAESTQILMNVSEFTDVSQATDTLISAVQAFGYTAETSMDVVDLLNTIGNNYAISTADLAQSLTKSSASLVAAGGDLAEAAALTATANAIIQDADSVGTALKTTSLRLRGTSVKVLEEEGLDSDGAVESTSKLRSQVLATSGVDILTDSGAYKSTYQILLEIAEVWDQITDDKARAGLLELLAGKRNSSVIAALLQNPEQLKDAYKDAQNASGSALKENEKYLDSIQGKIDQFNNAMQTMWSNTLDSDWVKRIVEFGTKLIEIVDDVGLLNIALMGVGMYLTRGIDFTSFSKPATESLEQMQSKLAELKTDMDDAVAKDVKNKTKRSHQKAEDATSRYNSYEAKVKEVEAEELLNKKAQERLGLQEQLLDAEKDLKDIWAQGGDGDSDLGAEFDNASRKVDDLKKKIDENGMSIDDANKRMKNFNDTVDQTGKKGAISFQKLGTKLKAFGKTLKKILSQMAAMYAITTALEFIGDVFSLIKEWADGRHETAEEAQEEFEKLNSELSSVKSELKNLNSELEDTQERIDELMSQGSLSFAEQEELNRLKEENAELERKIALNKTLEESLKKSVNSSSIHATDKYLDTSFGSELSKTERKEKAAEKGGKWGKYGGAAAGASIGFSIGGPIGALIGLGIGAFVGEPIGEAIGSGVEEGVYNAEQTVEQAMDNMLETRAKLKNEQDAALAENDAEAYNEATDALRTYDEQMAKHISQIQQNYNAMDWETASLEDRKKMMEYADWLDKYNISMGTADAKYNAIARIFGDEAQGNIANARDEINKLKENLIKAKKSGEGVDDALAALEGFKLNLSDEEVERLREIGIYLYEVEDYFKEVVEVESEFVNNDLEDVANDINKITDGLDSLKTAFDEIIEDGVLTAKTITSIKQALGIGDEIKDTKELTDAWSTYLKVMMSGAATTEEMVDVTEQLTQAWIEDALANNNLTAENKMEYIAQLRSLGVENAEEYVQDLLQKNLVEELKMGNMSDEIRQDVIERYGVEEKFVDDIIAKLKERQKLEQDIVRKQTQQKEYDKWRNGDGSHLGVLALQQEINSYDAILKKRQELSKYNYQDWEATGNMGTMYRNKSTGETMTYAAFEAKISEKNSIEKQYNTYLELKERYDMLWTEGERRGYIIDGKIIDPDFQAEIDNVQTEINGINKEIDKELTVDVQLALELQNKSELVDDIQNVFDTLVNAQKEYEENGHISVDTLQSLLQLEPKYLDLLVDESGNLNLTKDALYGVARARIVDMGIQSQKNILEQANQLASKGSADALREQITVMETANDVGADFVEVEMAKIRAILAEKVAAGDLTQAEADAFVEGTMNQIKAVQVATQSALDNLNNSLSSSGNTATKDVEDAFQNAMDYWENRIGANQSLYEQIQNDIDILEKQGKIAGGSYYAAQIEVENEHLQHLLDQREEARGYLDDYAEGSDEWWNVANTLNDIENEIDDVTLSIQDLSDAMDQVRWYMFDEAHERFGDLTTQLSNVRDILSADEDSFFNDEGEWTEAGVAVLGTHIQEIGLYKNALDDINKQLADIDIGDFDSEQEYYDKITELTNQQHDYTKAISDSEQSVVDMYESSIDAIEEYTQTLIDGYNDYIDSVKEALDAERDLYDFKKNIQKQAKDIAEIERRIMSLSGSTNAADIAERRRLEADLYGAREELDDTYYDHAKESQQNALDAEAEAYEESMNKFVEGLRTSLETVTANMDEFLMGVTSMVTLNAETVLAKYESTQLPLSTALTNPWEAAKTASNTYSGDALALMNEWTKDGGLFAKFNTSGTTNLTSPWSAGKTAAQGFATSIQSTMSSVYTSISSNIQNSITELNKLKQKYAEINDTNIRVNTGGGGSVTGGGSAGIPQPTPTPPAQVDNRILSKYKLTASQVLALGYGPISLEKFEDLLRNYQIKYSAIYKQVANTQAIERSLKKVISGQYITGPLAVRQYAKGTTGTDRDEWAIDSEPQFGDELVLVPGKDGNLSFMRKGTGVVPADLTANLMEWGQFTPDSMNVGGGVNVNMINNAVNKPEFNLSFEALVKAERIDENTLPEVKKFVQQEINTLVKQMNYAIKGKGGR